ncbi:MAG: hypothetical protein HKN03_03400 [Acidimicrobiales bacterium]|nr:hypothetical protein [Acidimicrobiales bacterium]
MTDIQTPPPPPTSIAAPAPTAQMQLSARMKLFVAITTLLLVSITFLTAVSDEETGTSRSITEVTGQSIGAALFSLAIAFGAYKGVKPKQPKVFVGVFSAAAIFVLLSALS